MGSQTGARSGGKPPVLPAVVVPAGYASVVVTLLVAFDAAVFAATSGVSQAVAALVVACIAVGLAVLDRQARDCDEFEMLDCRFPWGHVEVPN